jgi:hypothetical protein
MNKKQCKQCGQVKPLTSFDKVGVSKQDGRIYYRSKCHSCRWPTKQKYRKNIKKEVEIIKQERGCSQCKISDFRVLDFHHEENKNENIADMIRNGCSLKTILQEIEKCRVLCANCHRILHYEENRV